jgi:outer membrane protein OmpA-like peptidoglycan-associated protein
VTLAPTDLHKAKSALSQAEQAFRDDPKEQGTRDLAYVALRRSQLAEVMASRASEVSVKEQAEQDLKKAQAQKQTETTGALTQAQADLTAARLKTDEANLRTKALEERLTKLADVKEDARGTIVTLSASVLFPSNNATLLPAAETRLNDVSEALLSTKERNITIERYTDSRGSDDTNIALSQRRAEAVRSYLVSRGYEGDRIQAHGLGKSQPIASNDNAEGRANNRRVEIVLAPMK